MEILKIDYDLRPRDFYERDVLPAMVRTLERALHDLNKGIVRRVPQVHKYSSFNLKA